MPKHPVYTAMLPEGARAVIGMPHPSGRAAMRMLENEGFHWENYIDIFDGGPTMTVRTEQIRSIKEAADAKIIAVDASLGEHKGGEKDLVSFGRLGAFRAAYGWLERRDGGVAIDPEAAALLGVGGGDTITHVGRW
jgi:arginine N-succinyltransferase